MPHFSCGVWHDGSKEGGGGGKERETGDCMQYMPDQDVGCRERGTGIRVALGEDAKIVRFEAQECQQKTLLSSIEALL